MSLLQSIKFLPTVQDNIVSSSWYNRESGIFASFPNSTAFSQWIFFYYCLILYLDRGLRYIFLNTSNLNHKFFPLSAIHKYLQLSILLLTLILAKGLLSFAYLLLLPLLWLSKIRVAFNYLYHLFSRFKIDSVFYYSFSFYSLVYTYLIPFLLMCLMRSVYLFLI